MKKSHPTTIKSFGFYAIGSGIFLAMVTFSCDNAQNTKQRGSSNISAECVDDSGNAKAKSDKSSSKSRSLFLQGTGTGTGSGTGTSTSTGTGTGTARKVNYTDDMKPIFDSVCAGCHNTPPRKPFNSYSSVSGTEIRTNILIRVAGGSATAPVMPPMATTQLSAEQKAKFTQWQTDGFLETATSKPSGAPPPSSPPGNKPPTAKDEISSEDGDEDESEDEEDEESSSSKKVNKSADEKPKC